MSLKQIFKTHWRKICGFNAEKKFAGNFDSFSVKTEIVISEKQFNKGLLLV